MSAFPSCLSESERSVVLTDSGKNLLIGDGATGRRFLYQSAFEDELDKSIDDPMPSIRLITNFEKCDIGVNVTIQGPTDADTEDQKTYAAATQGIEGEDFEAWKLEAIGEYSVEGKGCGLNFDATDLPNGSFEPLYPKLFRGTPEVDLVPIVWHTAPPKVRIPRIHCRQKRLFLGVFLEKKSFPGKTVDFHL